PEAVMASACLPLLFHAVPIGDEFYWDGGYSSNPPILPFLQADADGDILIVQINPRKRCKVPASNGAIRARVNELTFNAPLLAELRAFELAGSRMRLHRIIMDDFAETSDAHSGGNTRYEFLEMLHSRGQEAAQ